MVRLNRKEVRREALKLLAGKKLMWPLTKEIQDMADKIRARQKNRGTEKFKIKIRKYSKKQDKKGSCQFCWPNLVSVKFIGHGRIERDDLDKLTEIDDEEING